MKCKNTVLTILAVTFMAIAAASCGQTKKGNQVGTMVCDKTFENIIRDEIIVFENVYKQAVVGCQYVTQQEAIKRLLDGETRLAVVGRDLTESEVKHLRANRDTKNVRSMKIAVDALALIVNPDNPVDKLSMKEIERILKGEVKTWDQVQPGAPKIPIRVVVDDPGSSLTLYMHNELMHGADFDTSIVITADSVPGVFNRVKTHKGDIGVIGVSWLTKNLTEPTKLEDALAAANDTSAINAEAINERMNASGVKTIGVMKNSLIAYKPTQENIYRGDYPLTRPIYMITTASPASVLGKFYTYVNSVEGQRLIMSTGVMPARAEIKVYEIAQ